jgi:hypothetical protein
MDGARGTTQARTRLPAGAGLRRHQDRRDAANWVTDVPVLASIACDVFVVGYYVLLESYLAQTVGKMMVGIRVVAEATGEAPGIAASPSSSGHLEPLRVQRGVVAAAIQPASRQLAAVARSRRSNDHIHVEELL